MPPFREEFGKHMTEKEYQKALGSEVLKNDKKQKERYKLRKQLRELLEKESSKLQTFDKHGNQIKCIHVTEVMNLLLEDKEISKIKYELTKLNY